MKEQIISEIRRLAREKGGIPPGIAAFKRATGIGEARWRGVFWARWSDAVADAGLAPNAFTEKLDSSMILEAIAALCRRLARFPTEPEIRMERQSNPEFPSYATFTNHFRTMDEKVASLRSLAERDSNWWDILPYLPKTNSAAEAAKSTEKAYPSEAGSSTC